MVHPILAINAHRIVTIAQIVLNASYVLQGFSSNLLIFFVILHVKLDSMRMLQQELVILAILNVRHVLALLTVLIVSLHTFSLMRINVFPTVLQAITKTLQLTLVFFVLLNALTASILRFVSLAKVHSS